MQGIVNVYKEKGWTSFDVVNKLKRVYNTTKIGHLGTLDPMAEGVLPVAIGKATKLFDLYLKKTKAYRAEFTFGSETDTLDSEGEVINSTDKIPTIDELKQATKKFVGTINQVPPAFSAVKVNGKRAYDLARKNVDFSLSAKQVTIFNFEVEEQLNKNCFSFLIECSAGTYIRSLARDLANSLGSLATMTKLTRIRSGEFYIKDAKTIDEIVLCPADSLRSLDEVLSDLPKLEIKGEDARKVKNGVKIKLNNSLDNGRKRIYIEGKLFAIGEILDGKLTCLVRLFEGEE